MTGTFWFKTKEQLEDTGWYLKNGVYQHPVCQVHVMREMLKQMGGHQITVENYVVTRPPRINSWMVSPAMCLNPEEVAVDKILKKYSK